MQLTNRYVEIMKFINEFGFCEILQIQKQFDMKKARSYQIMSRLVKANLVSHQRVFHGDYGVFFLTRLGSAYTDLPPIKNIPKDNYGHQLAVIEIYFKLKAQYPEAIWIGERRIKRDKFMKSVNQRGHIADGILLFPDGTEIAIEVELTMKSKRRLTDILRGYAGQFQMKEVWYYCSPEIIKRVSKLAVKLTFIKIHGLN